jgi:hypothetical protein
MRITEDETDLRRSKTLLGELDNKLANLGTGDLQPRGRSSLVGQRRPADTLSVARKVSDMDIVVDRARAARLKRKEKRKARKKTSRTIISEQYRRIRVAGGCRMRAAGRGRRGSHPLLCMRPMA